MSLQGLSVFFESFNFLQFFFILSWNLIAICLRILTSSWLNRVVCAWRIWVLKLHLQGICALDSCFNSLHVNLTLFISFPNGTHHLLNLFPHALNKLLDIISKDFNEGSCVRSQNLFLFFNQFNISLDLSMQISHLFLNVLYFLIDCLWGCENKTFKIFKVILDLVILCCYFL